MAVELISRPLGHKLGTTQVEAEIVDQSGDAVVYVPGGHSLSDGDYVYIESNIEAYNGFKYVDATAYDYFKIKDSENGDYTPYYQDADIVLYISDLNHGWQCVHLPIVYELQSDIWPNNVAEEEYNPNVVDSFENSNGYVKLNLDHALSDPTALSYIELVGDGDLADKYQIIEVVQPWSVVINLAYDSAYDFSGYTIVRYYNNYHINVEVWSGLEPGHRWEALKPFELATTLKFIPDSEGNVKFSIHDILKGYIQTRNNLTLETLPNNIDFHTSFYIKYYESYDSSDGEEITVFDGDVTNDGENFIGHAVNAMLPFKSLNSGFMSDYVGADARWLTLFDRPLAVVGYFFDLSFILEYSGFDVTITIYKSLNGVVLETEILNILNPGLGVIRVPIQTESGFDQYCLTASADGSGSIALSSFINQPGPGNTWTTGNNPTVSSSADSDILYVPFTFSPGSTYTFTLTYDGTINSFSRTVLHAYDNAFNSLASEDDVISSGSNTIELEFIATESMTTIGITVLLNSGPSTTVTLQSLSYVVESFTITEQICIGVVEECGTTFTDDNLRITDGSDLRKV